MRKIALILISILLITGCTKIDFNNMTVEDTISTVIEEDIKLYNKVYDGYKFYLPRGLSIENKNNYNFKILFKDERLYLYVDIVSYYYKSKKTFEPVSEFYLSKELRYNDDLGYINIIDDGDNYYIEYMYNYSKMEAYVEKENLNETILYMSTILSSIKYNQNVIATMIGENSSEFQEEDYDIFETKKNKDNFLNYIKEYDEYVEKNNSKDQETIDIGSLE